MWWSNFCSRMEDGALAHCAKCTEKLMIYARLGISPDQSGSQSNSGLKNSNRKPAETLENHIQSRVEMYYIKGLKRQHSRVPPVSLQVHAKAYAGGDGCQTWSFLVLDAF